VDFFRSLKEGCAIFLILFFWIFFSFQSFFSFPRCKGKKIFKGFWCENWRERKKVEKKAVTKNKNLGGGEKKFFDIFFSLNKIKRNVSIVEFCARRRVIFSKMFFSLIFSLEYANFCSILQSNQSVVDFFRKMVVFIQDRPQIHDISRPSTRDPEMRRYWFLFW